MDEPAVQTIGIAEAQKRFAELFDQVLATDEPVRITRTDGQSVAMLPASELSSLLTTVHLLRSRTNAERLFAALERVQAGRGTPISLQALRDELRLNDE